MRVFSWCLPITGHGISQLLTYHREIKKHYLKSTGFPPQRNNNVITIMGYDIYRLTMIIMGEYAIMMYLKVLLLFTVWVIYSWPHYKFIGIGGAGFRDMN